MAIFPAPQVGVYVALEVKRMLKRTLTTLAVTAVAMLTTAATAIAGYPPKANVKGKTIHNGSPVSPGQSLAFTGSNTMLWIALALVLLVIGVSMLVWSRRRSAVRS
jgi:hypothetical protein